MKIKLFTLLLMTLSFGLHAQYDEWGNGKVYLKDGTVLEGLVRFYYVQNNNNEKMRFKTERNKPSKKITAKNVDSIRFDFVSTKKVGGKRINNQRSALFITIAKNKKKTKFGYAKLAIDGKLKLLKRSLSNINHPRMVAIIETLFLKEGGLAVPFSQIELKSFKKRIKGYFNDCSGLVTKINNKQFGRKDLVEIAEYYNDNCGE
jgi:hypothetical protein